VLILATDFVVLHFYGAEFATYWPLTFLYLAFVSLKLVFEAFILFAVLRLMKVLINPQVVSVFCRQGECRVILILHETR